MESGVTAPNSLRWLQAHVRGLLTRRALQGTRAEYERVFAEVDGGMLGEAVLWRDGLALLPAFVPLDKVELERELSPLSSRQCETALGKQPQPMQERITLCDRQTQSDHVTIMPDEPEEVTPAQVEMTSDTQGEIAPSTQGEVMLAVQREVTPAVQGEVTPAVQREVTPAVQGEAPTAVLGEVTSAVQGEVTPALQGEVTPALQGKVTPAVQGEVTPHEQEGVTPSTHGVDMLTWGHGQHGLPSAESRRSESEGSRLPSEHLESTLPQVHPSLAAKSTVTSDVGTNPTVTSQGPKPAGATSGPADRDRSGVPENEQETGVIGSLAKGQLDCLSLTHVTQLGDPDVTPEQSLPGALLGSRGGLEDRLPGDGRRDRAGGLEMALALDAPQAGREELERLREEAELELMWVSEALDSRKAYLRLKKSMAPPS